MAKHARKSTTSQTAERIRSTKEIPNQISETRGGQIVSATREVSGDVASSTREKVPAGSRTIVGLMGTAVVFSLIGNEISKNGPNKPSAVGILSESSTIIFGGAAAAAVLSLIAKIGEPGRVFAVGLATIAAVGSVIVYGGPVWHALGGVVGSKPSAGSKPTTPTTPLASSSTPTNPSTNSNPLPIL